MEASPYRIAAHVAPEPAPVVDEQAREGEPDDDALVTLVEGEPVPWVPVPRWRVVLAIAMMASVAVALTVWLTIEVGWSGLFVGLLAGSLFAWQFRVLYLPPKT